MTTFRRTITIREDQTATFERFAEAGDGTSDAGTRGRVIEHKRVDASVLLPEHDRLRMLPTRCCGFQERGRTSVFLVEDGPQTRTVEWLTDGAAYEAMRAQLLDEGAYRLFGEDPDAFRERIATQQLFALGFPYLLWCYQFVAGDLAKVLLYYRVQPTTRPFDELLIPNLPNRNQDDHTLCITQRVKEIARERLSMVEVIAEVEREFWGSRWNQDWTHEYLIDAARIPDVSSPWEWERATAHRALFALGMPWRSAECTVGDVVDRLLREHERDVALRPFETFVAYVKVADPYDGAPLAEHEDIAVSPADIVVLRDVELRKGDTIVIPPGTFVECDSGGAFPIEWFGVPVDGCRFVQLKGIAAPLRIVDHGRLLRMIEHQPLPVPPVTVAGQVVERGTIIRFSGHEYWSNFRTHASYIVEHVRRDATGMLLVHFMRAEQHGFTVLAEGEDLFPEVTIAPKEHGNADGYLLHPLTLTDGTRVGRGTELCWSRRGAEFLSCEVAGIRMLQTGETGHLVTASNGAQFTLERADGALADDLAIMPREPIAAVTIGGKMIRVGDEVGHNEGCYAISAISPRFRSGVRYIAIGNGWVRLSLNDDTLDPRLALTVRITITDDGTVLHVGDITFSADVPIFDTKTGTFRTITRFVRRSSRGGIDVVVTDRGASQGLAFIRNFTLESRWQRVVERMECGDVVLERGLVLRLTVAVPSYAEGTQFTISHLVPPDDEDGETLVVLEEGLAFVLCRENAWCFEWRRGDRWLEMPRASDAYPATPERCPRGAFLTNGCRVRYVGGTGDVPQGSEQMAQMQQTLAIAERDREVSYWALQFGASIAGLHHDRNDRARLWNANAESIALADAPLLVAHGFLRVFRRPEDVALVASGRDVGRDRDGTDLHVGDRVTVTAFSHDATNATMQRAKAGHRFTVVHAEQCRFSGRLFLFLDAGTTIGTSVHAVAWYDIPDALMDDPTWWDRLAFAYPEQCVRCDDTQMDEQQQPVKGAQ